MRFVPGSDPNNTVTLGRDNAETDESGHFVLDLVLPKRPSEDVQYIRATLRRNVGAPHFTQTAHDTWDKIVETVFLALLATVFGTVLAIPMSFIAARNLTAHKALSRVAGIANLANRLLSLLGFRGQFTPFCPLYLSVPYIWRRALDSV